MNISLITAINSLGYGQVGKGILTGLNNLGVDVSLFPIAPIRQEDIEGVESVLAKTMNAARMPDFKAPCIRIWHQHDMSQFVGYGPKIGFPIFELNKFNKIELHHLNYLDRIYVCSDWAKQVICSTTVQYEDSVVVIPLGVETYDIVPISMTGPTRFFTCGKWEIRKGHDVLVEAFNRAFTDDDNVELHMMCTNPFLPDSESKKWLNLYANSKLGHKIRFIDRVPDHKSVISIMSRMDCGVFISRAEGWNLELLEMMALGKPVIATNYSGHTQFCNKYNSLLVDIDTLEPATDNIWFHGQGDWAKLGDNQVDQIVDHMRRIHGEKSSRSGLQFSNIDGITTGKKFTWNNTAQEIINDIKNLGDF